MTKKSKSAKAKADKVANESNDKDKALLFALRQLLTVANDRKIWNSAWLALNSLSLQEEPVQEDPTQAACSAEVQQEEDATTAPPEKLAEAEQAFFCVA